MKISIVIPAYNEERMIRFAIEAAQKQDYSDFEIIVVDNACTDKTAEVARGMGGVKVVREDRKGLLYARGRGYSRASGEIIANLDADCLPETDWLSRGARHFEDESVVCVSGPYDYYDAEPGLRRAVRLIQLTNAPLNKLMRWLNLGAITRGGNTMIRSEALRQAGGYDTSIEFWGEDVETAKRMSKVGKVIFDNALVMRTSARRFKSMGAVKLTWMYFYHFFAPMFKKQARQKGILNVQEGS